ncbi:endoglucanase E-4-like [Saccoglossus kowalevskii]
MKQRLQFTGGYDYIEVLHQSILFYEAQRSGVLPEETNRISYRSHSALGDQGHHGENLTGGWYDAGDHVKFGLPMAASLTNLAWGMIQFEDAYRAANAWNYGLDGIRWAADYFVKCHVEDNTFYYQVADPGVDHAYWGRPEEMTDYRPSYLVNASLPGSDVAGETAAALAASSILFKETDPVYAALLLNHSKTLFNFSATYLGVYPSYDFYISDQFGDELGLAASWLYYATEDSFYLETAEDLYVRYGLFKRSWGYSWREKNPAVQALMYQLTQDDEYANDLVNYLDVWLPGGGLPYTPGGLAYRDEWGSLRYAANTAFVALVAADLGNWTQKYFDFGKSQIHYILGDYGHSYVVGYGVDPPRRAHHRSSSCEDYPIECNWSDFGYDGPNHQTLYGGIVGGPDINDYWEDDRADYRANEVACDYNAAFQSAIAGLKHFEIAGQP